MRSVKELKGCGRCFFSLYVSRFFLLFLGHQAAIRERHDAAGIPYEAPRKPPLPPVVLFKEKFQHSGPNGKHMCLVFEMLGKSFYIL